MAASGSFYTSDEFTVSDTLSVSDTLFLSVSVTLFLSVHVSDTLFLSELQNLMDSDFLLYVVRNIIISEVGTGPLSTSELNVLGRNMFPQPFFLGVFPAQAKIPVVTGRAFYLQNTEPLPHFGKHWLGVALKPGYPSLLFDSYGRVPSRTWMPELQHMETTDPDPNQHNGISPKITSGCRSIAQSSPSVCTEACRSPTGLC